MKAEEDAPERVWYSESRTISLGRFNSVKIDAGYATTRQPKETVAEAIQRASLPVIKAIRIRERKVRRREY